jgi:hypothetical protein
MVAATARQESHTPKGHYAVQDAPPPADTSHIRRKFLDIPYAHLSPTQKLDIYLPDEGEGPFPVIVAIHGGAFMGCDKGDLQVLPMLEGLKRGYAVVAINYRLSWEPGSPLWSMTRKPRSVGSAPMPGSTTWTPTESRPGEGPPEAISQPCWGSLRGSRNWRT